MKPYKREGKTWLYDIKEVNKAGITYKRNFDNYYPIPKFEEKYWINKDSKIINVTNEKCVMPYQGTDGYIHIVLKHNGKKYRKRVHSLMGQVFLGNPPVVNHKDGDKSNNLLDNLERSTHSENIKHAYDHDYYTSRGSCGTSVIAKNKNTGEECLYSSMRKAENATGVDRHRIKRIIEQKIKNYTNWDFEFN